jgi:uracil-DNA glycosylase family 4
MDALRRNQYLQTIGVDVWVPRHPVASGVTAVEAESYVATASEAVAPTTAGMAANVDVAPASAGRTDAVHGAVATANAAAAVEVPGFGLAPIAAMARPVSASTTTTWESLRSEVLACTKCALHASRTQGVFGVGNREAQWLVVGEAPGAEEDRRGEPFVGRAGHLLDAMLKAIGLSRGRNVYIANVLKSRPPGNRDPKPEEVAACLPYLMRQIELLKPRVMLAVGRIAAQNLLATDVPLGRLRGKVHHFGELNTPLIVTYHPAYLLRTPGDKRKAWEDLKFARSVFQGLNPTQ